MLLLIAAGIGIAASVFGWYNGKRTAEVEARIAELEAQWAAILGADAKERKELAIGYILAFRELVANELASRNEIATSLAASLAQARGIVAQRFGSAESDGFLQAMLEMELAQGRIDGERAQFQHLLDTLPSTAEDVDFEQGLPSPDELALPANFPCLGSVMDATSGMPAVLHGYSIEYAEKDDGGGHEFGMFTSVDHAARSARVSLRYGTLMMANLADGGEAIPATVQLAQPGHVELAACGARFALGPLDVAQLGKVRAGSKLSIYPGAWTVDQLLAGGARAPLPARLRPRITGTRTVWSPISLAVTHDLLPGLVEAYNQLEAHGRSHEKWMIHTLESGDVCFTQGDVTLSTSADLQSRAFTLNAIEYGRAAPLAPVSLYVELNAFVPGTEDDDIAGRALFPEFLDVLNAELKQVRAMYFQRQSAVRLRKLSMIYQDQREFQLLENSCGFIVGAAEGGVVEGALTSTPVPAWLERTLGTPETARLRAVGQQREWNIRSAEWIDKKMGLLRLTLDQAEKRDPAASPFQISRIERAGEGAQQQTFSRALEGAISGRFVSPAVHHALTGRSASDVEIEHLGRDAVERLLHSGEPVLAIWGPPGTGKTTLLVEWLLSQLAAGQESDWPSLLITGPTNIAVTKLVGDLLKRAAYLEQEVVRYGREDQVQGTALAEVWHKRLLAPFEPPSGAAGELDHLAARWHALLGTPDGRASIAKWILGERHIHATTCAGMTRRDLGLSRREFDIVIIDEAGKAFDAELFIPAARARRLILVGDHYQLPPTVTDEVLNERIPYRLTLGEVEELLSVNCFADLFERLPAAAKGMLTTQYRMHRDIGILVSQLFYQGRLDSHRADPGWDISTHRLTFIDFSDTPGYRHVKDDPQSSPWNATECKALEAMLVQLDSTAGAVGKSVLIVCPYKGQREKVQEVLERVQLNFRADVTTVDAVQGGEADIVFLLMTRSRGRVEFLLDRHRLNVALSRARDAIYILGHRRCLSPDGTGPVADLVRIGLQQGVLRVIRSSTMANRQALARAVFIAQPGTKQPGAKRSAAHPGGAHQEPHERRRDAQRRHACDPDQDHPAKPLPHQ